MPDLETTSFMRSLCMGQVEQELLFPFPSLPDGERQTLREITGALDDLLGPRGEDFRDWDVAGAMPADFLEELRAFGLFGLVIPEAHGGMGLGSMAYSRTLQQVGRHDASVAVTVGAHSSIGMRGLLLFVPSVVLSSACFSAGDGGDEGGSGAGTAGQAGNGSGGTNSSGGSGGGVARGGSSSGGYVKSTPRCSRTAAARAGRGRPLVVALALRWFSWVACAGARVGLSVSARRSLACP